MLAAALGLAPPCAALCGVTPAVASASAAGALPPGAALVAGGDFAGLSTDGSDLFAVDAPSPKTAYSSSFIVRINPRTGAIVRRSATFAGLHGPYVTGGRIWVVTTSGIPSSQMHAGTRALVALDPRTLHAERRRVVPLLYDVSTGPNGLLWVASGCSLERLSAGTGAPLHTTAVRGSWCTLAIDESGKDLFAVAGPAGNLDALDANTGRLLRTSTITALPGYFSLVAAGGNVWLSGSGMSMPGALSIYRESTLRLVKRTRVRFGTRCTQVSEPILACGAGFLGFSGGVLWASGPHTLGCYDARTRVLEASSTKLAGIGPVVIVGSGAYSIYQEPHSRYSPGIIRFTAPRGC